MATKCAPGQAWDTQRNRCRPMRIMKEVTATGKSTPTGKTMSALIKAGVGSKEDARKLSKLMRAGMSGEFASKFIKSLPKKMQEGGEAATSGRMTRLGNKIARKTTSGKTVSTGLQKRYDKAVDNVFRKPKTKEQRQAGRESLRKIAEEKKQLMEEFPDAYGYGGAKMAKGGATSFGMLSVKAGIDKNPKPTAADRIAGAKKKKRK